MEQTTNEAVVQKNPGGARLKKGGKGPLVALGIVVGVLVLAYVGLCAYAGSLDTFYPNRHINGIDVGGMTAAEAQKKLEADLLAQEITLTDETTGTSAAITVASSCVGPIIPPSITLVLYGILAGEDVGKLLIAGIVPGVIIALFQMVYTHFYAVKMDYPSYPKATPREMGKAVTSGFSALMMPIIIIGGTLSGVFTPTESAAVAVLYGIIIGFFIYRNLKVPQFYESLKRVGVQSMNNMFILAAAACFSWVLTITKAADVLVNLMLGISTNQYVVMLMILALLMFIGFFMQASQALVVLTPMLLPVIKAVGIDPIHFGIVMVVARTFGGCTPPVGSMLFVVNSITKMGFARLTKAMVPLYIPLLGALLVIAFVPQFSLFLPGLMG